jgi:hypothetical protein
MYTPQSINQWNTTPELVTISSPIGTEEYVPLKRRNIPALDSPLRSKLQDFSCAQNRREQPKTFSG